MKKILALLAALVFVFALAGCGEYTPPENPPGGNKPPVVDPDPGGDPNPGGDEETPFTVTLTYNSLGFDPGSGVQALWYEIGGNGIYRSAFDENGVAKCEGLDGDYRVTLSAIPDGFTYDPNDEKHIATNENKDISIPLYRLTPTTGGGTHIYYDIITLNTIGAYRATLTSRDQVIYYQYAPQVSGEYSMTSIIDITANVINPILDIYNGNTQFKVFSETRDGGGYSNTFTKNFQWQMLIDQKYIGGIFAFAIRADALSDDAFPVNIDFILDKDGEYRVEEKTYTPVPVTEEFISVPNPASGMTFNYAAALNPVGNRFLLDASCFKLYPKADGGDGYYHFYDEDTKEYGARLYVKISSGSAVMDAFTNPLVNKRVKGKDYNAMIEAYAAHCNSTGVYPVTEEIKIFLEDYANAQQLFRDGDGWAETEARYDSTLVNQWLFPCGFYTTGGAYRPTGGGTITDLIYS